MAPGNDEPQIVGLRDIYNATRETGDKVTVLVVEVGKLNDNQEEQKEENRRLWAAVNGVKMRMYTYGGAIAVITFLVANLGTFSGIVGE